MKYLIEFNGKVASLKEHCKDLNIPYSAVKSRHQKTREPYKECLEYYQKYGVKAYADVKHIEFNGKIASLAEHCKDLGIKISTIKNRHKRTGDSYLKCLEYYQKYGISKNAEYRIEFNGKIACITEHCRDLGIKASTVMARHYRTGEPYLECLEYYQKNGIQNHNLNYRVKDERLYRKWYGTKQKCENPKHPSYKDYGGRGIKVCERWQTYENFEADLLDSFLEHVEKYGLKQTTIDRWPNNDGDYEPNNVRWASYKEQANNRRNNHMLTDELSCTQFAEKYGLNPSTVIAKANRGLSAEEILSTQIKNAKYYLPCNNGTKLLSEHCKQNGYTYDTITEYIKKYNLQPHEALAKWLKMKKNSESISQIAKELGVSRQAIYQRLQKGQTLEQIIDILSKKS